MITLRPTRYLGLAFLALLVGGSSCTQYTGEVLESQYQFPIVPDPVYSFTREGASSVDTQLSERIASASDVLYSRFLHTAFFLREASWEELNLLFREGGNNEIALQPYLATSPRLQGERQRYLQDFEAVLEASRQAAGYEAGSYSTDRRNRPATAGVTGFIGYNQGDEDRILVTAQGVAPGEQFRGMILGASYLDRLLWQDLEEAPLRDPKQIKRHEELVFVSGHNYTELEHRWDEAYGFYSAIARELRPEMLVSLPGVSTRLSDAFALGRRAITEYRYEEAIEHLRQIRPLLSQVVARRAVEELYGANTRANLAEAPQQAFRFISRGLGLVYALQFTRQADGSAYLSAGEVERLLRPFTTGEGLWRQDLASQLEGLVRQLQQTFALPS